MVCHEDSIRYLQMMESVDWIFIDPPGVMDTEAKQ